MPMRRGPFSSCSIVALTLAVSGCKKDEPSPSDAAAATQPAGDAAASAPEVEASDQPAQSGPPPGDPPVMPEPLAVEYPVGLDALLDLVPADAVHFGIVRDPSALLALAHPFVLSVLGTLVQGMPGASERKEIAGMLADYTKLRTALERPELQLDKGMAVVPVGDDLVLVYGASTPDALPSILGETFGDPLDAKCDVVKAAPGYVACARTEAGLSAYAPGMKGADLRAEAAKPMAGVDLERANVLGVVTSERIAFVVETPPGLLQASIGVPASASAAREYVLPAKASALGLLGTNPAFLWMNLSVDAVKRETAGAPAVAANVLANLTGEVLIGSLDDPRGIALLAGVREAAPVAGLLALASTQLDALPKTLPDGSALAVSLESLELDGAETQALHAVLTPSEHASAAYGALGLKTEAWGFAAGKYAGALFGIEREALDRVAKHSATDPGTAVLAALPAALARALADGHAAMAMHAPFDGLGSAAGRQLLAMSTIQGTASPAIGDLDPAQMMQHFLRITAPLSSFSQWITVQDGAPVGHLAIAVFGDARSDDGEAALDALEQILAGKDAAPLYAALAAAHGSSPRGRMYQARAGEPNTGMLVSIALVGMLAAIAVPAFQQYTARARAVVEVAPQ